MALTLTLEDGTGLSNSNTFASIAEADAYHESLVAAHRATWDAATGTTKGEALVMATRLLDRKVNWQGTRSKGTQALAWPRDGVECDGHEVSSVIVPQAVKDATSELARLLIANDLTVDQDQNQLEAIGLGKGALEIKFNGKVKARIPSIVDDLLGCFGDLEGAGFRIAKTVR